MSRKNGMPDGEWSTKVKIALCTPPDGGELSLVREQQRAFLAGRDSSGAVGETLSFDWKNPVAGKIDGGFPEPVFFSWECGEASRFLLQLSEDPAFPSPVAYRCGNRHSRRVENLKAGTRYFWRVLAEFPGGETACSEVFHFFTAAGAPRWIRIPGLSNVRDCGAWKSSFGGEIRQGMLYRGSEMDRHMHLTPRGREIMRRELKIRTDLDIRSPEELEKAGHRSALGGKGIHYAAHPILPYDLFFREENAALNAACFSVFFRPDAYPVYCHCYGGADRTGTLIFLLLALLGVSDSDLIADYELTSFSAFGARSRKSDCFLAFRRALNCCGAECDSFAVKAENYFRSIGIRMNRIKQFRTLMLN